jgi:hypothetical protein
LGIGSKDDMDLESNSEASHQAQQEDINLTAGYSRATISTDLPACDGGIEVNELDVDVPLTVIEMVSSLRIHAPLFGSVCSQSWRRILASVACFITRLACWHESSNMGGVAEKAMKQAKPLIDKLVAIQKNSNHASQQQAAHEKHLAERKAAADAAFAAASNLSESEPSGVMGSGLRTVALTDARPFYLKELDEYVMARLRGIDNGIGYDLSVSAAMLRVISPSAADTLCAGLECMRTWALEAPWLVLPGGGTSDTMNTSHETGGVGETGVGIGVTSPVSAGKREGISKAKTEAENCRVLHDRLVATALICGAYIAPTNTNKEDNRSATANTNTERFLNDNYFGVGDKNKDSFDPNKNYGTITEYLSRLPGHGARVACLATQLLEALARQVGQYPVAEPTPASATASSVKSTNSDAETDTPSPTPMSAMKLFRGTRAVSSRVTEATALAKFGSMGIGLA